MQETTPVDVRLQQQQAVTSLIGKLKAKPRVGSKEYHSIINVIDAGMVDLTGYPLHKSAKRVLVRLCSGVETTVRGDAFHGRTIGTLNGKIYHGMQPMSGGGSKTRTQKMFGGCGQVEDRPDAVDVRLAAPTPAQVAARQAVVVSGVAGHTSTDANKYKFEIKQEKREVRQARNAKRRTKRKASQQATAQ